MRDCSRNFNEKVTKRRKCCHFGHRPIYFYLIKVKETFFESLEIGDDDVDRVASTSHSHILAHIRRPAMFSYMNTALKHSDSQKINIQMHKLVKTKQKKILQGENRRVRVVK
jgi:hypothetical protein